MEQQHSPRPAHAHTSLPVVGWIVDDNPVPASMTELALAEGFLILPVPFDEPYAGTLVIIDCKHFSSDRIHNHLMQMRSTGSQPRIALYDVGLFSRHEQLISWPQVKGFFASGANHDHLAKGIHALLSGENWFPRRILDDWINRQRDNMSPPSLPSELPDLTLRERQILRLINRASTNAQIAYTLSISEHTVKTHLYNIFRKISVRNRTQASNWVKANLRQVEA